MSDELTDTQWASIKAAFADGNKIEAIRLYRSYASCDLATAKAAVDALHDGTPKPSRRKQSKDLTAAQWDAIKADLAAGRKIEAIRRYRDIVGCDLVTAKDVVDRLDEHTDQLLPDMQRKSGCFGLFLVMGVGLGLASLFSVW
jgi:ribosomal protein L7/L12